MSEYVILYILIASFAAVAAHDIVHHFTYTCEVECFDDGVDENLDGEWYSYDYPNYELSCGHRVYGIEPPKYCPECGREVKQ